MKKTMLTYRTLDRFEELMDIGQLTGAQIERIEHAAYCANMLAGERHLDGEAREEFAWQWFAHILEDVDKMKLSLWERDTKRKEPKTVRARAIRALGKIVRHSRYSYRLNLKSWSVERCLTGDENRQWLTNDGDIVTAWVEI